jgi:hypothetical protein
LDVDYSLFDDHDQWMVGNVDRYRKGYAGFMLQEKRRLGRLYENTGV